MATNGTAFRQGLQKWGDATRRRAGNEVNDVTRKLYTAITTDPEFPVDTRRAQASFAISIGEPGTYVPPEVDRRGRKKGDPPVLTPQPVGAFSAMLEAAPLELDRCIYSNLEYIGEVEWGSPSREGSHAVALAINKIVAGGSAGGGEGPS